MDFVTKNMFILYGAKCGYVPSSMLGRAFDELLDIFKDMSINLRGVNHEPIFYPTTRITGPLEPVW